MTPKDFCYWLQGYAELGAPPPTAEQWEVIKDHLQLVFTKVTPDRQLPAAPILPGPVVPVPRPLFVWPPETTEPWKLDRQDQWPYYPDVIC